VLKVKVYSVHFVAVWIHCFEESWKVVLVKALVLMF